MYPRVSVDLEKLKFNCLKMIEYSKNNGIDYIMPVIKVLAGDKKIASIFDECGFDYIGDSRIKNLKLYHRLRAKKYLVRIPSLSEVKDVVKYANLSLNSELETIKALNLEAERQNKKHEIILMFDLGDLREGFYYSYEHNKNIKEILELENIILKGIGTNLTCYGGLIPSFDILNRLVEIKNNIEDIFQITLDFISGGNSSSLYLFGKNQIPKDINSLRIGEGIFFGKETAYSTDIDGFYHDIFTLQAEIIECKTKPSFPDGETSINSFGEKTYIEDKGLMKRAILAVGKQDVILENLKPRDNELEIIGGSSDHLIINLNNTSYKIGDIIEFDLNYPGLLHLMNSPYVKRHYKKKP